MFSTLKKYRFLTSSSNAVIRLFGGVLLVALFALVPNRVSAYTDISIPSSDTTQRLTTTHNIRGGCFFTAYDVYEGFRPYLGSLLDGTNMCGYRFVNNKISYYDNTRVAYSQAVYNGSSFNYSPASTVGGYNILNTWSESVINEYGQHAYNTLHDINLVLQNCPASGSCSDGIKLNNNINGYAIFVYSYKPTADLLGSFGTTIRTSATASGWGMYNLDGSAVADYDINAYADDVSKSIVFGSFSSSELENLLPENMQQYNRGDDYQYIIGAFPTFNDKYLKATTIPFLPENGINYNWSYNGGVLNLDGYFDFLGYQTGGSYKNIGKGVSQFDFNDVQFGLSICTNSEECDYYSNFNTLYRDNHSKALESGTGSGNTSVFMGWFDIFNFGLLFPFTNFFNAFSGSNACVSVPIIGGMLHNPNTQYCSWWSSDIRNVLTPVFSIASIMLIFGFIMHWLRSNDTALGETKGGKK